MPKGKKFKGLVDREVEKIVEDEVETQLATAITEADLPGAVTDAVEALDHSVVTKVSAAITEPPTIAQLESAFGTAASHAITGKSQILGTIKNTGGTNKEYIIWTDGTDFYLVQGTKSVAGS